MEGTRRPPCPHCRPRRSVKRMAAVRLLPRFCEFQRTNHMNHFGGIFSLFIRDGNLYGGRSPYGQTNWPDILRSTATMVADIMPPSQLLKKFASHPRQHDLAIALREIGRVERTLFIIDWLLDADMQRRAQIGLNKGESHHALKNALRIGRQGEIRDRTAEGQHYRMAGLNLLAAIIIYWNTDQLGKAVAQRKRAGLDCSPPGLLAHISPLGWAHILITGEYRWSK